MLQFVFCDWSTQILYLLLAYNRYHERVDSKAIFFCQRFLNKISKSTKAEERMIETNRYFIQIGASGIKGVVFKSP